MALLAWPSHARQGESQQYCGGELYREVFMERVAEGLHMVDDLLCRLQVQGEEGEESVNEASKNNN